MLGPLAPVGLEEARRTSVSGTCECDISSDRRAGRDQPSKEGAAVAATLNELVKPKSWHANDEEDAR